MILLEVGNLDGLFALILGIMFGPPIILILIGFGIRKTYKTAAKVLFILAAVYATISLGVCGSFMV